LRLAKMAKRIFVLGLDAFDPKLCFEKFKAELPNLSKLMKNSSWGISNSSIPPLSCTAWISFAKGKTPGHSAIQGFTSRKDFAYTDFFVANSTIIEKERLWDILAEQGKKCIVMNVPVTFPPYDVNGIMVSSFLTPNADKEYCYPKEIKQEINEIANGYVIDVKGFKKKPKNVVLKELKGMEEKRFKVAKHFIENKDWEFFIFVTTGTDRIHHAFWADMDETHPDHKADTEFKDAILSYYKFIDEKIGEVASLLGEEDVLLIMSDHGAREMHGFVNVNEFFIKEGYMKMQEYPSEPTLFNETKVDWNNTKVFCTGNYIARIFVNLKGREPQGIVKKEDYEKFRDEIKEKLLTIRDEQGKKMNTKVFKREEVYKGKYVASQPDLIIYFDDLKWGANQMIGFNELFSHNADKGRNSANHYHKGMFLLHNAGLEAGKRSEINLIDLMPTIIRLLDCEVPTAVEGKSLV
tara:strand:- start:8080 stop:9474 length:1395 start_codon:yes stop_codon:yes gene_type:complete